ncbi:MAG: 4-hydroxy-3-methylbut-2-enyl diphosphate reductase [Peptococcaceae bacterium BRH_c4a]|nr:MAG: 4-hydroxy-3-methylbut-2-enyl diphosphate reductase [Peptococcaceae bacterium BRH_c4a]
MKVLVASCSGFCYGVKRAVELAKSCALDRDGPVYSLGPIIHNKQVVDELIRSGINVIDSLSGAGPGSRVIIRSHGVGPEIINEAKHLNIDIVDATCPFVAKAQRIAGNLTGEGIQAVVVGDRDHPEVRGIIGWTGGKALVVANREEVLDKQLPQRVGVLAQTTQTEANFKNVVHALKEKCREVAVYNTICNATGERQKSAVEMSRKVDAMVVVGGIDSSNTAKLAELCTAQGTPTYRVETADELQKKWFEGKKTVGITAGASTPQRIIEEVERRMKELGGMDTMDTIEYQVEKIESEEIKAENPVAEAAAEEPGKDGGMGDAVDIKPVRTGEIVTGVVVQINQDEVLVDVGSKSEGVISLRELACCDVTSPHDIVKVGDKIDVFVLKSEDKEGRIILSKEKADAEKTWGVLEEHLESGEIVNGTVREMVKGGLLVDVGVRAFLPASLVDRVYVEDLSKFLGQEISAKVIELNRPRKKVILSRKALLEEEYAKNREEMFDNLQEKQVVRGIVRRLTNFGAFVDIGGLDGLLHISEMAWYRINNPSEIVKVGDEVDVMILRIDRDNEKISLGLKQVMGNPWEGVEDKYPVGAVINAKVVRLAPFGAFVQLEPGVEGLVHISHLAERHIAKPDEVVSEGQEIPVKVLSVDPVEKRIRLSIREVQKAPREPRVPRPAESQKSEQQNDGGNVTIGDLVGNIFDTK